MQVRTAFIAFAILSVAFVACSTPQPTPRAASESLAPATGTPSPSVRRGGDATSALPPLVASLGAAPADCPASPPPDRLTLQHFGGGFTDGSVVQGRAPLWTMGLGDGRIRVPRPSGPDGRFPNLKVMWIVGPDEAQPVTIEGRERTTGAPLWFQVYPSNAAPSQPSTYATTLLLGAGPANRGTAENAAGTWTIWGVGIGALSAGCYEMSVRSSAGSWTETISLGG